MNLHVQMLKDVIRLKAKLHKVPLEALADCVSKIRKNPEGDYLLIEVGCCKLYMVYSKSKRFKTLEQLKNNKLFGLIMVVDTNNKLGLYSVFVGGDPTLEALAYTVKEFNQESEFAGLENQLFAENN